MRGEVLHFDQASGQGFIRGSDENRYLFHSSDMKSAFRVQKGTRVEFDPDGDLARGIIAEPLAAATDTPTRFGRFATVAAEAPPGLFGYFRRAITRGYAGFRGRARRKEFWGYMLFLYIGFAVAAVAGLAVDSAIGTLDGDGPWAMAALIGLVWIATLLPSVAVMVRRQHDIGLSGWFFLLILIPYIGGLILLVFAFIPSQKHANRWGPVPDGVV